MLYGQGNWQFDQHRIRFAQKTCPDNGWIWNPNNLDRLSDIFLAEGLPPSAEEIDTLLRCCREYTGLPIHRETIVKILEKRPEATAALYH